MGVSVVVSMLRGGHQKMEQKLYTLRFVLEKYVVLNRDKYFIEIISI